MSQKDLKRQEELKSQEEMKRPSYIRKFSSSHLPFKLFKPHQSFQNIKTPDQSLKTPGKKEGMSKYASLPDIDTAPDVYETPDVSSILINDRDDDSDGEGPSYHGSSLSHTALNEDINQNGLDQSLARKRFSTTTGIDGSHADFSSSLLKPNPRQSSARYPLPPRNGFETNQYSIIPRGYSISTKNQQLEQETPLERLRRLRYEIEELEEELEKDAQRKLQDTTDQDPSNESKDDSTPPSNAIESQNEKSKTKKAKSRVEPSPAELLAQLQHMRDDLGKLSSSVDSFEPTSDLVTNLKQREAYAKTLLQQLTNGNRHTSNLKSSEDQSKPSNPNSSDTSAAKLDARLNALENLLGSTSLLQASSTGDVTLPPPLLVTINKLEHQLSLLTQPRHLDSVSRRVKVIVTDLERVHEARRKLSDHRPLSLALASGITVVTQAASSTNAHPQHLTTTLPGVPGILSTGSSSGQTAINLPPDSLHKLERLYNLLPRLDPLLPLVPHLLIRLRSLSELHLNAQEFSKNLNELEGSSTKVEKRLKELDEILNRVELSIQENESLVKNNLTLVEDRIDGLVNKLDSLIDSKN
ncbi:uncharacterized protein MELLADRAFT_77857 [Melampsora larici-populina 98AG31]|uniref:Dynactin subunit 2 n=1 Tax=Melampsora larici-populina (strain 98AG31 / pathotype 3-4-7) TaxID=747676 RepID=F4RMP2_MELLP|nr:uncharacterized protein MELLADRAFT_77857 [Melampsora larici-populina 98AG31]EGG06145.1 hypothetical protein MELLADRAFT_77857 [Melampsora larici-populina 98AG31]